ncbi:MAG: glycosyltransferase [Bacteroidales bacterium]|nr:glycosyltransferase [Bacteroidales bacterium]
MIENRDFIVFGLQPWDLNIGSTCKYTAKEIARKNRVLFVNKPLMRSAQFREKHKPEVQKRLNVIKGKEPEIEQVGDNIWLFTPPTVLESINWINNPKIFNYFNKVNDKRFARHINRAIERMNLQDYILLNDNSMLIGFHLKEFLKPSLYIYLLRDAVTQVYYHRKHGVRMEPELLKKVDLVVTNSHYFEEYAQKYNPNAHMIGQGCDVGMYSDPKDKLEIPQDLKDIKRPLIGYTGSLTTRRLDIDLIAGFAKARPDWSIVLVGPEDEDFKNSELHQIDNVIFLGRKDPDDLPSYVKGFDVAINPQAVNEITDINYPLKIDEYLAMGKPVVATKTTFMHYFEDHTYLAKNANEYVEMIDRALKENNQEKIQSRMAFAGEHTWENFVHKIYKHAKRTEQQKQSK